MSALLWAVVVFSTLAWAVFDVLRKRLATKVETTELALWLSLAQVPFCAAWWLADPGPVLPEALTTAEYLVPALASVVFNVLANLLFLSAVGRADLGATIPLLSLTPVFVALGSIPLLGEHLGARNWLGILLVTAGAIFLPEAGARPTAKARLLALVSARHSSFMVATAALWALTPVCDKLALRRVPVSVHATLLACGVALGTALLLAVRGASVRQLRARTLPILLASGGVSMLALGLQFVAISNVTVSIFEAFKRAVGLLLALGFGAFFFRERLSGGRLLAGALMAAGVVLVLLPR